LNRDFKGYSENKLQSVVNKTSKGGKTFYFTQKNMYILKVLLNIVTTGIEALVISGGISFCMPVSKKSAACELSHVLTPSINYYIIVVVL
jgi:hypothetical protein